MISTFKCPLVILSQPLLTVILLIELLRLNLFKKNDITLHTNLKMNKMDLTAKSLQ